MSTAPSLYRRHRPRSFADVVGQEHVVRTLRNAVSQGKLHHAYLFVGSRGTGKTSMAKILASCLNCVNGPTIEPCGVCDSCLAIASATSMDVIEMDAASNNSVDDIRGLRDSVAFAPVSGRYKVYILDEAHMLSAQAWNAFLKTLEEPPPSTIFVLATTEANKVLPTVVDRCHRFDFARPTVEQLASVVQRVADQESIAIPRDAVALLARHATGSFRDALGTLEQLVTYSGAQIAVEDVLAVLGVADAELLFGALDSVAAHDARAALHIAARLAGTGRDIAQFVKDVEAHARELLVVQVLGEVPPELAVTPDHDARLAEQSARVPGGDIVRLIDLLAGALRATKDGADARTQLELALVKAATPEVDSSTRALMARIERLENALTAGRPAPPSIPQPPAPAGPEPHTPPLPPTPMARTETPAQAPPPTPASPAAAASPTTTAPPAGAPPSPAAPVTPSPAPAAMTEPAAVAESPAPAATMEPAATAPLAVAESRAPAPAAPAPAFALADLLDVWPAVLDMVREQHALLAACLLEARPVALQDGALTLAFDATGAFHRRQAEDKSNRAVLIEAVRTLTGAAPRLTFELRDLSAPGPDGVAPAPPPSEQEWVDRLKQEFDAEEIVPDDHEEKHA